MKTKKRIYADEISAPIYIDIEVTTRCNEKCLHCYNSFQTFQTKHYDLEKEKINKIIDTLIEKKIYNALITGGEPLLAKESLFYILDRLYENDINISLNSNLTLANKETVKQLKEHNVHAILTSLMSYKPEVHDEIAGVKGSWEKTIQGIHNVQEEGILVSTNMVLSKKNVKDLYETAKFAKSIGINHFCATKAAYPALNDDFKERKLTITKRELIQSLYDLLRVKEDLSMEVQVLTCYPLCLYATDPKFEIFSTKRCTAGVVNCVIDAQGNVRSCNRSHLQYGNMLEKDFSTIWKSMNDWRNGTYIPKTCYKCNYLSQCTTGCRLDAHEKTGKMNNLDPFAIPKNVPKIEDLLSHHHNDEVSLKADDSLIIEKIKFRPEKKGTIISKGFRSMFLNKESTDLILMIMGKPITSLEISKEYNIQLDNVIWFMNKLLKDRIIRKL